MGSRLPPCPTANRKRACRIGRASKGRARTRRRRRRDGPHRPGGSTEMTAVMKRAAGASVADAARRGPVAAPSYRARILVIVEDETVLSRTVTRLLVAAGYEVSVARDGAEAIAHMKAEA